MDMTASKSMFLSTASVLLVLAIQSVRGSGVPVLIWGNNGVASRLPIALAGHTLETDSFRRNYLDSVMPCRGCDGHNVIVFLIDKLSLEDLTQFGDVYNENGKGGSFNNIKSYMDSDESLALSSVKNPADSLSYLKGQFGDNVHVAETADAVKKVPFGSGSRLVIVPLPNKQGVDEKAQLTENDKLVGEVISALHAKKVPFTALFTAQKSSKKSVLAENVLGRHLLAANDTTGVAVNISGCFLMYYTELNVTVPASNASGTLTARLNTAPITTGSKCGSANDSAQISLSWTLTGEPLSSVVMKLNVTQTAYKDWSITDLRLTYSGSGVADSNVPMDARTIGGPLSFSYACGMLVVGRLFEPSSNDTAQNQFLTLCGFQLQAFYLPQGKFGYANDCTPFFSIPILSGLIIGLILLAILAFGMNMVANITTMDRFDDPKGRTINVNAPGEK